MTHDDDPFDPEALEGLSLIEAALHADSDTVDANASLLERGEIPQSFDGLELKRRIGRGGMGEVYLARQVSLDRDVAVKLRLAPSCDTVDVDALLAREARTLASLEHPGIVRVLDAGSVAGRRYLVMEQVRGRTLREWLERRPEGLSPVAAVSIARGIADALAAAHAAGVVHRDLKPSNVLVGRATGSPARVRLVDFGIAGRAFDLTESRELGTWDAMAPEQRAGEVVGPPADVYALGVLLGSMIGGRPDVPGALHRLVASFTALDPAHRPADGAAALERLERLKLGRVRRERSPSRVAWLAGAALIVLLNLLGVWWFSSPPEARTTSPRDDAPAIEAQRPPPPGPNALRGALRRPPRDPRDRLFPPRDPRAAEALRHLRPRARPLLEELDGAPPPPGEPPPAEQHDG
ncbi:MAG: hypothetical protein DHS20C15_29210 [Planctomycetota bacterium]|nr:MAG: hypothetical protein DHS20C15_29210 [Planctomycetota bacterium]